MRRAIWMALAFMGTAPLMVLAQQTGGAQAPTTQQPAASPSGTAGFQQGQDTTGAGTPGAPGQQAAGAIGTTQGEPAAGGAGTGGGGAGGQGAGGAGTGGDVQGGGNRLDGTPLQRPDAAGGQGLMGGTGTGGGGGTVGPTYRGTTETTPPAAAPLDVGSQVGPEPGERAGTSGTGTVGAGTDTGGAGTGGGGQASAPVGQDAMGRELSLLRERVTRLEAQVNSLGQGGGGTAGGGDTGGGGTGGGAATAGGARDDGDIDPEDIRLEGPVAVANVTFDGTVREVSRGRLVIVDNSDGSLYNPVIDKQTKVFKGEELSRISPRQLAEGMPVRVSLDLIGGEEHARNIIALEPEQLRQQQPRQGQGGSRQQAPSPQPQIDLPRRGGGMR